MKVVEENLVVYGRVEGTLIRSNQCCQIKTIDGLHLKSWRPCWRYNTKEYVINSIVGSSWRGWLTLSATSREIDCKPRIRYIAISNLKGFNVVPRLFVRGSKDPGRSWSRDAEKIDCLRGYKQSVKLHMLPLPDFTLRLQGVSVLYSRLCESHMLQNT